MVVRPRIRNNICLTAHPKGCARQVAAQVARTRKPGCFRGPRNVLVVGGTNGYGLAARIAAAFGAGARTVSVGYERPGTGEKERTGTAGWYNDLAFLREARREGLEAESLNADAFLPEVKERAADLAGRSGGVDLVVYSIAAPRRTDPETGELYTTAIKPIDRPFSAPVLDFESGEVGEATVPPATGEEIAHTVKVMGGEDWLLWIRALREAGALARGAVTVAFSYLGPELTAPIYREGTMGRAKAHLEATAAEVRRVLEPLDGGAWVSVNKALVTRASAVIPGVPLYIALLYTVMKRRGLHEECIDQMNRLLREQLYSGGPPRTDSEGRIRLDDRELRADVQEEVARRWEQITTAVRASAGGTARVRALPGELFRVFREEFLRHHGFCMEGVDYGAEVEV